MKDDVTIYNETAIGSEALFSSAAQDPRQIIDWLPRILLVCALLHLIPRMCWEQNVGHILKSYLSYMSNLITIIKGSIDKKIYSIDYTINSVVNLRGIICILGKCEKIPNKAVWGGNSIPKAGIFDENSSTFDCNSPYELLTIAEHFLPGQNEKGKKEELQEYSKKTNDMQEKFKEKVRNGLERNELRKRTPRSPPNDDKNQTENATLIGTLDEIDIEIDKMDEKDLKMKLDDEFTDRHLFSQLCYRNFAHLPDMTFIESVQRVVTPNVRVGDKYDPFLYKEKDAEIIDPQYAALYEPFSESWKRLYDKINRRGKTISGDDPKVFGLDDIEKQVANYEKLDNMGVLWSITKLFTCEKNFSGKKLIKAYKRRLYSTMAISLAPAIALLIWRMWFDFEEIVEIIRCIDETESQERFSYVMRNFIAKCY